MKQFLSLIAALVIATALTGCSNLYNSTPEFAQADQAYWQTRSLAVSVRGSDRQSKISEVKAGELFYANCDTFSRTVADLLIDQGADPAEVYLVIVEIPVKGFVWEKRADKWQRVRADVHQIVEYKGLAIDNRWGVVPVKDLEWEYEFVRKMNLADQRWIAWDLNAL